jgi:hypothetical protein
MKNKLKNVNFQKLNLVMAVLLLFTMFAFFTACSKDKGGGASVVCGAGYVLVNNVCQYNGAAGGPGVHQIPSYQFIKNGNIPGSGESEYRDFVYRYTFQYYNCWYSYPYRCNDLQVSLKNMGGENFIIYIKSPMNAPQAPNLYPSPIPVMARRVLSPTNPNGAIFESIYYNPYPYVPMELWINGTLDQQTLRYTLYFEGTNIGSGTMRKGIDY